MARKLVTIMYADVAGRSRPISLGEEGAMAPPGACRRFLTSSTSCQEAPVRESRSTEIVREGYR